MRARTTNLTSSRRGTPATLAIVLGLTAAASVLGAVPRRAEAGETESHSLFVEGRELRKAGQCAEAITAFRRALETYPEGLGALRNIAECEEELGRFASARRSYWDLRLAALQSAETKYAGWDKDAEEAHTRLGAKVAKVTVTLEGTRPDDLVIQFNGRTFDPRLLGVEIEQDNGPLEVSASFGAGPPVTKKIVVVTAGRHAIELDVKELHPAARTTTTTTTSATGSSDGLKIGGIVALGVGGAGLVGTGITLAMRQAALGAVKDACPDYETKPCPASVADDKSSGETASLLVNVFAATAIVGAGVGITLLLLAPGEDEQAGQAPPRPHASITARPLPGGGFVGLSGSL